MNDMNGMLRFRESFRGYNRDDVNAYIEQMNMIFSRKEGELRAYIADLESRASAAAQMQSTAPAHTDEEWKEMNATVEALRLEVSRLTEELSAARTAVSDSESVEKSKLYDSMSAQVGNILIVANNNADKILSEAHAEADKIRLQAEVDAQSKRAEADRAMEEMVKALDQKLKTISDDCLDEYRKLIADAQVRFGLLSETMKTEAQKLLHGVDQKGKELEEQISTEYGSTETIIEG